MRTKHIQIGRKSLLDDRGTLNLEVLSYSPKPSVVKVIGIYPKMLTIGYTTEEIPADLPTHGFAQMKLEPGYYIINAICNGVRVQPQYVIYDQDGVERFDKRGFDAVLSEVFAGEYQEAKQAVTEMKELLGESLPFLTGTREQVRYADRIRAEIQRKNPRDHALRRATKALYWIKRRFEI